MSYSLYLWHWGVLSISRWTIGIYWWTIPFQSLLIFLLSYLSFEYIEKPLIIIKGFLLSSISAISIFGLSKPLNGKLFLGNEIITNNDVTEFIPSTRRKCNSFSSNEDCKLNLKMA